MVPEAADPAGTKRESAGFAAITAPSFGVSMMRLIFAVLLTLPLAACGSSHDVSRASASPPTVSFNVDDTKHMDDANERAAAYCSQYDRPARLDSLGQLNESYVATYSCR
jgi:hypothetical protein